MAYILGKAADLYIYLNEEASDPRVKDWLFMSSPVAMFVILFFYLNFVLSWGPKWMRDRKPFNVDKIMIAYNFVQILACVYLVYVGIRYAYARDYCMTCQPIDYTEDPIAIRVARGCHWYFLLKVADLMDTIFFVLRKKERQISFLHVYHHTGMVLLTWNATKFLAGGHSIFTGFINSIIHIVMYSYYLLTAYSPKYKNNVWFKKYITQMQIVQFFMIMSHWLSLWFVADCGYPKWPVPIMISQNFLMLILFGNFYRKNYLADQSARTKKAKVEANNNNNDAIESNKNVSNGATKSESSRPENGVVKRH